MEKPNYICRCEEVTWEEVLESIRNGADTLDAVKKATRAGLGYCQGKSCKRLVAQAIAAETGTPVAQLLPGSVRPPVGAVELSLLAATDWGEKGEEDEN